MSGVFFRLHALDRKVFWHDEVYTTSFAAGYQSHDWQEALFNGDVLPVDALRRFQRQDPSRGLIDTVAGLARDEPQHPPLYYALARLWVSWLGDGVGRLRLLSALLGLLALPAIWVLADELCCDRRVAGTAAALLAVSPYFVLYAQEAREYALWGVLTLASTAQLLRAIRFADAPWRRRTLEWGAFALLTALSLYTAFSAAAVILGQIAWICGRERFRPTRVSLGAAAAMAVAALLFLPWAVVLFARLDAFRASMAWSRDITIPRAELLSIAATNLSRPFVDGWDDPHGAAWAAVVAAGALVAASGIGLARGVSGRRGWLAVAVGATPLALLIVPDLLFGGIRSVSARYLCPTAAMSVLAVAWLLGRAGPRWRTVLLSTVAAAGVLSCLHNDGQRAVWTKGISLHLPEVADLINRSPAPLVVGNRERHNPGNLLALSRRLRDDASVQFLAMDEPLRPLPTGFGAVYAFSPTPTWRAEIEARDGVTFCPLLQDLHLELWQLGSEHDTCAFP